MKIVPIIRDGKIVMDDINEQYPVTNVMWRYMDSMTLGEYLGSLGVDYNCYVHVTTVNGKSVYCVDVLN